jgi:serine/threonine-protein kinase
VIGQKLGDYAIEKKLGQGGMGAVFAARNGAGEACALKVLSQELAQDPKARARFEHECRVLRDLEHPRIVRAISGLEAEGERFFYTMELVPGEDLAACVERRGALPAKEAVAVVADVLEALSGAHARSVLHRDVKPSNVFVDASGRAKLGDFGIALVAGATRHTGTGTTLGTPEFMAPEVARGEEPTARTDLYAAGVLLYFLLEGRPPFQASQPLAILKKQVEEPAPPLRAAAPARLARVVTRALAKDPGERFLDAASFREALLASLETGPEEKALAQAETRPLAQGPKPAPVTPSRKRNWLLVGALVLVLALVASHGAPPAPQKGETVLVTLKSGDKLEGEYLRLDVEGDVLLVKVAGDERRIPLGEIATYEKKPRGDSPR